MGTEWGGSSEVIALRKTAAAGLHLLDATVGALRAYGDAVVGGLPGGRAQALSAHLQPGGMG